MGPRWSRSCGPYCAWPKGWLAAAGLPRFNYCPGGLVPVYSARVLVSLRPSVLDPAGEATRSAASRLGVEGIVKLRIGKAVELEIEAPDLATARERLSLLSDRLLANTVIENWTLELAASGEGSSTSSPVEEG